MAGRGRRGLARPPALRHLVEPGDLAWFDLVQRLADSVSVRQDLENPPNEFYAVLSGAGATHGAFDDRRKMARDRQRLLGLVNSAVLGLQVVPLARAAG